MNKPRIYTLIGMVLLAALSRLVPHPWNVAPITGMALFAGSYFDDELLAFGVPLSAMFLSDLIIGFYATMWSTYIAFALIVCLGFWIGHNRSVVRIALATVCGSVLFFIVTNAATWLFGGLYSPDLRGLAACFTLAIPFFRNTLLGDAFYSAVLFGGFALAARMFPVLRSAHSVH